MANALAHHEQHRLHPWGVRVGLLVGAVGDLLVAQQLARIPQLGAFVLGAVLAVDDDRHLHVPVRDGLTQRVLEHDLGVVGTVGSRGQPHQRNRVEVTDRCRERLGLLMVDVMLVSDDEQVIGVFQVGVQGRSQILVLVANLPAHLVARTDQLLHVEDEHLQPTRIAQDRTHAGRLEVVRRHDDRLNVGSRDVLGRGRIEVGQRLALDRGPRGHHQHVPDTLLGEVLDEGGHEECLAHTRGQISHHLLIAQPAICNPLHDLGESVLVGLAQVEACCDLLDQGLVVRDLHSSHVSSPSPSGRCHRGPS
ncbi:hypothetical protein SDC9_90465 [bioreactor metagenome]|uniref:Uncharacterized protein n=1 Tax=bioreactor metagenome TaxID=1076179 RepID=A0A644ZTR8_9ZZZZ